MAQAVKTTHKLFLYDTCLASQTRIGQWGPPRGMMLLMRDDAINGQMHLLQPLGFHQFSVVAVVEDRARIGCYFKLQLHWNMLSCFNCQISLSSWTIKKVTVSWTSKCFPNHNNVACWTIQFSLFQWSNDLKAQPTFERNTFTLHLLFLIRPQRIVQSHTIPITYDET